MKRDVKVGLFVAAVVCGLAAILLGGGLVGSGTETVPALRVEHEDGPDERSAALERLEYIAPPDEPDSTGIHAANDAASEFAQDAAGQTGAVDTAAPYGAALSGSDEVGDAPGPRAMPPIAAALRHSQGGGTEPAQSAADAATHDWFGSTGTAPADTREPAAPVGSVRSPEPGESTLEAAAATEPAADTSPSSSRPSGLVAPSEEVQTFGPDPQPSRSRAQDDRATRPAREAREARAAGFHVAPPAEDDMGAPTKRLYVVKDGESIFTISIKLLGKAAYFPDIMKANPDVDPKRLRAGQVIVIPEVEGAEICRELLAGPDDLLPEKPRVFLAEDRLHVIEAGETLGQISLRYYKTSKKWPHILKANPGLNPNLMREKTEIVIPALTERPGWPNQVAKDVIERAESIRPPTRTSRVYLAREERYIIEFGDTLQKISKRHYGVYSMWEHIEKANPGIDRKRLEPGTEIVIPALTE